MGVKLFKRATRANVWLRMLVSGVSGSGKTWTAIQMARGIAGAEGEIAVIDSEQGSSQLYGDMTAFDVVCIDDVPVPYRVDRDELGRYAPERYIEALKAAVAEGYTVAVVDSLTHAWAGEGGILEIVDWATRAKFGGNSHYAWAVGKPLWSKLLSTMVSLPIHVIVTSRSKAEYVETEKKGRKSYEKVGVKPDLREDAEYEFDLVVEMDAEHNLRVVKSRYHNFTGLITTRAGADLGREIIEWVRKVPVKVYDPVEYEAALRAACQGDARVTLPAVARFCEALKRPSPAAMTSIEREKLRGYLAGEEGRSRLFTFLTTGSTKEPSDGAAAQPAGAQAPTAAGAAPSGRGGDPTAAAPSNAAQGDTTARPPAQPAQPATSAPAAASGGPAGGNGAAGAGTSVREQIREINKAIAAERQSLGETVFAAACQSVGVDPGAITAAGIDNMRKLLAALREAAGIGDGAQQA